MTQRRTATSVMMGQFGHPTGALGHLAGAIMALRRSNRVRTMWTVDQLDVQPADRVLEIGYGPGLGIAYAARRATSGRVVGVDVSETMRHQASWRNRAGLAGGRVSLHVGTVDDLDPRHTFTKAMAVNVFMFWPDPVGVLSRLSRLFEPGATVALTMQPRNPAATGADATAAGERMAAALASAGYTGIQVSRLPLKPVDAACALGRRA